MVVRDSEGRGTGEGVNHPGAGPAPDFIFLIWSSASSAARLTVGSGSSPSLVRGSTARSSPILPSAWAACLRTLCAGSFSTAMRGSTACGSPIFPRL